MRKALTLAFAAALAVTLSPAATADTAAAPLYRVVCNGMNSSGYNLKCGVDVSISLREGGAPSSVKELNSAYAFIGDISAFYGTLGASLQDLVGHDYQGTNAVGVTISGPKSPTFYSGGYVVVSSDMLSDDTTAHEFTHAVQDKLGKLTAGEGKEGTAVSEAIADIFGELVDLNNKSADDTAANRWKIGEGAPLGVYRNMADPNSNRPPMPDRKGGQYWATDNNIRINGAVLEKAAFLIADGQNFNGQNITGIGLTKSAALWWTVLNTMPQGANYKQISATMKSACAANVKNNVAGTTTDDCSQVTKAITATQMER